MGKAQQRFSGKLKADKALRRRVEEISSEMSYVKG